jgi:sialic acid synthase
MFENLKKDKNKAFVIAEIGCNHQGSVEKALDLIKSAKQCGADAVKFQKRNNKTLFTKELYNSPYDNRNSYGETYGEHREYLEFGKEEYKVLQDLCKEIDIHFFATPFDFESVDFLSEFDLPAYKIASADMTHTPLLEYVAQLNKPIILSTGGGSINDVIRAVDTILPINDELVILHCTSSYPALYHDMNLNVITKLIRKFPNQIIGLSDHENGAHAASLAYQLGARVFEKHFTLNRAWKGTDHSFSLEPRGLTKLIRNLSRIPGLLGDGEKKLLPCEEKPLYKMRKSIVANKNLKEGTTLDLEHFDYKCPGSGLEPYKIYRILGSKLKSDVNKGELLTLDNTTNHIGINKYGKYSIKNKTLLKKFFFANPYNIHEENTIRCVLSNVNNKSIITAGTFIGLFLPAYSKSTDGKVYGFEPIHEYYLHSKEVIELNELKNVMLSNNGLSYKHEKLRFIKSGGQTYVNELSHDYTPKFKRPCDIDSGDGIECVDLDSIIPIEEEISVIQLDVEWFELNVLMGAKRIIRDNLPLLILEVKGFNYTVDDEPKQFFEEFLEPLGYKEINMVHNNYVFKIREGK